ncbi:MAG: glucose-6-phosphate dehydrogenase [Verrucomicrobiota bacterium]
MKKESLTSKDEITPESIRPFRLVIFGASGDLTKRKLVPALFGLYHEGSLPEHFEIIGFARREKSDEQFREEMLEGINTFSRFKPVEEEEWSAFSKHISYHQGNFDEKDAYQSLATKLAKPIGDQEKSLNLFYLSTAPEFFVTCTRELSEVDCVGYGMDSRIVVEKPVGHDYDSAKELVNELQQCLDESSIYRIDHYLGKETVQNMLYFRFANSIFEPIWNSSMIDHIQITVAEEEGVGTRGGYYDGVGALRDMVQNHLMQLLTITAMEPPATLSSDSIRDEKVKVLRSIPTPETDYIVHNAIGAQYEGYRSEDRVDAKSTTETYVGLKLMIDNWRWAGVPFYLRTGKCMPVKASEIIVVFKRPPHALFHSVAGVNYLHRNRLHIRLQPDEGIHMAFAAKIPGKSAMDDVDMDFAYTSKFGSYSPEAYERLLNDFIIGDSTLFTRSDEVLEAWRITDAISTGLRRKNVELYRRGSWGPAACDQLLADAGNSWVKLLPRAKKC